MSLDTNDRYATEIELLKSMYAEQVREENRELSYTSLKGHLLLRIPHEYLVDTLPEVVVARVGHEDARDDISRMISGCMVGEEILDAIILAFIDIGENKREDVNTVNTSAVTSEHTSSTIVVWLHHLLNTNKRKRCLAPGDTVSGITKPGYPGVLIYSGPSDAVHDHVNELKQLNWAAFQIRLEMETEWKFVHGKGVIEVEAMKDVVADIEGHNKEAFLESMRMK